jgi:signal transduction histidine kinase
MGGEIGYTSDPGRETVFWFTVRRQDDEDEAYDFARSRASAGM